ncbi:DUF1569 domain-containing protein [Pedobacter sp. MW01-1-1]|uniref:DUF1569 domain-containing protein n=1 Tax=Pedobacter sp. MW01-1-1 TaxID=3383027 RepID=UPI003FEF7F12
MKNIFLVETSNEVIGRINQLNTTSTALWGKMNVAQMLAHCNVTYEMVYTDKHPKPGAFMGFLIKLLAKSTVVGDKPFKKNIRTAPAFLIVNERKFEDEKARLIEFIKQTQLIGERAFDGKESHSFGRLSADEWNNMFYKHLDHHLTQFGV